MSAEFSFLCGYSYTWKAGYKPKAFEKLEKMLINEEADPQSFAKKIIYERQKDRKLVQQLIDSYGKLGFLFLSKDYIEKINGKVPLSHMFVTYHLFNFIYDSKAFLDSVAVMLNDFYTIGKTDRHIDFKESSFRDAVVKKEPKLQRIIKEYESWFVTVASWRRDLIHRFSTIIAPFTSVESWPTEEELHRFALARCVMPMEPRPYLSPNFTKLKKKYGKEVREIEPFCEEWIDRARDLYDQVCNVVSEALE